MRESLNALCLLRISKASRISGGGTLLPNEGTRLHTLST